MWRLGILAIGLLLACQASSGEPALTDNSPAAVAFRQTSSALTATVRPQPAHAEAVDPRRLAADANAYRGKNLTLQGKALTVEQRDGYTWVQVLAQAPDRAATTESIAVEVRPKDTAILRDDCYRFYGMGAGTQQARRALTGAENTVPLVQSYQHESC